jgi:glycosyltransferase involved in cell wall biosynthesis
VTERVTFLGQLPSVGEAMARAHVVIAPSRSEWTPLSLMEAMAARRPVVAARVGGVAEVVPDGDAGLLVAAEDVDGLTAALATLAADPGRAAAMGRRGREVVERRFDIERSLRELEGEIERARDPQARKPLGAADVLPA